MSSTSTSPDDPELSERPAKIPKLTEVDSTVSSSVHTLPEPTETENDGSAAKESSNTVDSDEKNVRRGRTILSFGYLGEGYCGLQSNENAATIEPVLLNALIKAGAIDPRNSTLDAIQWDRCARTDKGVSAACNFASLNIKCLPDLIELANSHLPEDMRFWHYQRVGKSFRAHVRAETRRYQYLVPTQLFRPKSLPESDPFQFDENTRAQVQLILNRFLGSHRFHHYTQGLTFKDPQSNRTINSFTCGTPFMESDIEWVQITVVGTSFVLNQIRKMVACVITVFRDGQKPEVVDSTFQNVKHPALHVAPGEGLYLDECSFDSYNQHLKPPNEPVLVDSVRPLIDAFIKTKIIPSIVKQEIESKVFTGWIKSVDQFPIEWDAIAKEGEALFLESKETSFAEAKRRGLASARGITTAEEYYQRTKNSNANK